MQIARIIFYYFGSLIMLMKVSVSVTAKVSIDSSWFKYA